VVAVVVVVFGRVVRRAVVVGALVVVRRVVSRAVVAGGDADTSFPSSF
jgi:hypothetical protein